MKKHIALVLGGLIAGSILFFILYKLFHVDDSIALSITLGGSLAGIGVEYLKLFWNGKHKRDMPS